MTEYKYGDAFYVNNKFILSSMFKIEYGITNHKIDITNIVEKKCLNKEGIITIPTFDFLRAQLFGDPLFGTVKYIFISDFNGNELIYDEYQTIEIDIKNTNDLFQTFNPHSLTVYKSPYNKIRLGKDNDGGYIICDIPNINYNILISGGVKDDISFEENFCNKYNDVKCIAFDGSIDNILIKNSNIKFVKKYIGGKNDYNYTNLHDIIDSNNNIFIKMDIEGWEYDWIYSLQDEQLQKISQIVIEFHKPFYFKEKNVFDKLNKNHILVHFHANNAGGIRNHKNIKIPNIFECTYINKKYYNKKYELNNEKIPSLIDMPNVLTVNEIHIDYPPFVFKEKYIYNFCIMSIFKNETMNLKVWLEHYLWQGVEHFYLIDNDSSDNPLDILQEYIDKGLVTYFFKPEKYQQENNYRNIFDNENLKEKTKWLCICDLDEFFFGSEKKLVNALDEFDDFDIINTQSFFYGNDNLIKHPKDIRTQVLHRTNDILNGNKFIFKPSSINNSSEIWMHWLVEPGTFRKKSGLNEVFTDTKIRLNHYIIQSLEYWQNIKMKRGDVNNINNENIRNMDVYYFYEKEANIKDDILKQIIENTNYTNFETLKFYDENNNLIDNKSIECHKQELSKKYIIESDVVLELGARYGSVSCTINKKLYNKKNQVSVEPDDRVWNALEFNKIYNNCNFNIVKGFISNKKLDLTNLGYGMSGYGATFIENNNTKIPSYSLNEIKNKYNINKFTALVADCEGFLERFFDENPELYNDLRIVIFEAYYEDKCNYNKIKQNLYNNGFKNEISGHQNVWIKP